MARVAIGIAAAAIAVTWVIRIAASATLAIAFVTIAMSLVAAAGTTAGAAATGTATGAAATGAAATGTAAKFDAVAVIFRKFCSRSGGIAGRIGIPVQVQEFLKSFFCTLLQGKFTGAFGFAQTVRKALVIT